MVHVGANIVGGEGRRQMVEVVRFLDEVETIDFFGFLCQLSSMRLDIDSRQSLHLKNHDIDRNE